MTNAPDTLRSCHTKRRYGTEAEAHEVAAARYAISGVWLRAYACEHCGGHHLSSRGALPPQNASWRPPAKSQRQLAHERRVRKALRRGRR